MNTKFFSNLCLMLIMGMIFNACSNEESLFIDKEISATDEKGMHYYKFFLNCNLPTYEDATTRSAVYTWDNASTLIVRFKSGSKYIDGLATYSSADNLWTFGTYETLPISSGEETCELYYFYGDLKIDGTNVTMSEKTACYYTTTAKYRHSSETSFIVNGFLDRKTWRLRFKGNVGTEITLPGIGNDIKYFSSFKGNTGSFSDSSKDVKLTVGSDGYTNYIYGNFVNTTGDNQIVVLNGGNKFTKKININKLSVGESAYLSIPTLENYKTEEWTLFVDPVIPNCQIVPKVLVTYTDGYATSWTVGSNVATAYTTVFKSLDSYADDEAIIEEIKDGNTARTSEYYSEYTTGSWSSFYKPSTTYWLCTIAYDSNGNRGELYKQQISTKSTSDPIAKISNLRASTHDTEGNIWQWDITMTNTSSYYLISIEDELYDYDEHWFAHIFYSMIQDGTITSTYSFNDVYKSRSGSKISVLTYATGTNNTLGNYSIARATTDSSAKNFMPVSEIATINGGSSDSNKSPTTEQKRINTSEFNGKVKFYGIAGW